MPPFSHLTHNLTHTGKTETTTRNLGAKNALSSISGDETAPCVLGYLFGGSCALLGAFVLSMPERPDVERLTDFYEYPGGSGYEGRFTRYGICTLMQELGSYDLTPAPCHPDYTMSETGGATSFVRTHTLASGGLYCDCGYKKKNA